LTIAEIIDKIHLQISCCLFSTKSYFEPNDELVLWFTNDYSTTAYHFVL